MPSASRQTLRAESAPASDAIAGLRPRSLESRIHERIEKRLGPRIHDLRVTRSGKTILIEGRCATYYSKQLAQHAALGVIEDEQLDNAIVVSLPR